MVLDRCANPDPDATVNFLALGAAMPESLAAEYRQHAGEMPQSQLGTDAWRLESDALAQLRAKLTRGHRTLKDAYGSPCRGVVTGLNEAFVVDRATRDRLIAEDPKSAYLLKPFLEGKDLKKWRIEPQDLWLIYIPKNRIDIDAYPAIKRHLLPYRDKLEKRATKQAWFELQQAQAAYSSAFEVTKIGYVDMSDKPNFSIDTTGAYYANTGYFIPSGDWYLLALLSSSTIWWFTKGLATEYRGGFFRLFTQYVEQLPIPSTEASVRSHIAELALQAQQAAECRRDLLSGFRRRILADLAPAGMRLNTKLTEWSDLDFKAFHDEVKKLFKQPIPLAERDAWQTRFEADQQRSQELTAEIAHCERTINAEIYRLFNLTPAEIALIESGLAK